MGIFNFYSLQPAGQSRPKYAEIAQLLVLKISEFFFFHQNNIEFGSFLKNLDFYLLHPAGTKQAKIS